MSLFYGFVPEKLKTICTSEDSCISCGGDVLKAKFILIHSDYKSEDIFEFKDYWYYSYLETFNDAIKRLVGDRKGMFILKINKTTFPLMLMGDLKTHLMAALFDEREKIQTSIPFVEILVHF